jgi:hypothetical protein
MKHNQDTYTLLLPFDQPSSQPTDLSEQQLREQVLLLRLGRYLLAGHRVPTQLPLLKLLPSLNNPQLGRQTMKFTELEAATILQTKGAIIEQNPYYMGRSQYRVTILAELVAEAIKIVGQTE